MFKFTIVLCLLLGFAGSSFASNMTKDGFNIRAGQMFNSGAEPTDAEMLLGWTCFEWQDDEDYITADRVRVFTDGKADLTTLSKKNGALLTTWQDQDNHIHYVAFRIAQSRRPRLIVEYSSNIPVFQLADKKSAVTGFTPAPYTVCIPKSEFEQNLILK